MRTEKGVTLISVIIYVIVMLIMVSVMTVLTGYFYQNIDLTSTTESFNQQYTRFNTYFVQDINRKGIEVLETNEEETDSNAQKYIVFSSGNQYTFIKQNKAIYMNTIKIANNIEECTFTTQENDGKVLITVLIKGGEGLERTTTYALTD